MKILAIGDIHNDFKGQFNIHNMPDRGEVDVVCLVGDLTNQGTKRPKEILEAQEYLWMLAGKYEDVMWIPGNHDIGVREDTFTGSARCIYHKTVASRGSLMGRTYTVFGGVSCSPCYDGAVRVNYWDYMTDDPAKEKAVFASLEKCNVLISHSPPYGHCDTVRDYVSTFEKHVGSQELVSYIQRHKPKLVICGHIHECFNQESWIDQTRIVNVATTWKILEI